MTDSVQSTSAAKLDALDSFENVQCMSLSVLGQQPLTYRPGNPAAKGSISIR